MKKFLENLSIPFLSEILYIIFAIPILLCGCSAWQSAPPSSITKALYNITTNVVTTTNVVAVTNMVTVTNQVPNIITIQSQGIQKFVTNQELQYVTAPVITLTPVTQLTTNVNYSPSAIQTSVVSGTSLIPGFGTLISGGLAALFGIFGAWKSKQASTSTAITSTLSQAIATAQSVIAKTNPTVAFEFNAWLAAHKSDADLAGEIASIVDKFVDPAQASGVATTIVQAATTPIKPA